MRCVVYRQPTSATAADEKPDEKSSPPATGLGPVAATIGICGELLLVAFELGPIDVPFVMFLDEDLTILKGAMVAIGLAGAPIDDLGAMLAFTVGVGACVERVL